MILKSLALFLLAALCEVGGGYLVWLWIKENASAWLGLVEMALLGFYGIVASFQIEGFGRVFAAYGGIFIMFSIAWAFVFDDFKPDRYDVLGAVVALLGVMIIMYFPR